MLRIAICDGDEKILFKLEETTGIFFKTHCVDCRIQTYQSSENLWYDLQDGIYYDIFLLDIEMPQVSGMDLAEKIRDASPAAKIIFIIRLSAKGTDGVMKLTLVFRYSNFPDILSL